MDNEAQILELLEGMLGGQVPASLDKLGIPSGAAKTIADLLVPAET